MENTEIGSKFAAAISVTTTACVSIVRNTPDRVKYTYRKRQPFLPYPSLSGQEIASALTISSYANAQTQISLLLILASSGSHIHTCVATGIIVKRILVIRESRPKIVFQIRRCSSRVAIEKKEIHLSATSSVVCGGPAWAVNPVCRGKRPSKLSQCPSPKTDGWRDHAVFVFIQRENQRERERERERARARKGSN